MEASKAKQGMVGWQRGGSAEAKKLDLTENKGRRVLGLSPVVQQGTGAGIEKTGLRGDPRPEYRCDELRETKIR